MAIKKTKDQDLFDVKTDISLMKKDLGSLGQTFEKIEATIGKIQEAITSMTRMITLHEERIGVQIKEDDDLEELINSIRSEIQKEVRELDRKLENNKKELLQKIEDHNRRIWKIDFFRATLVGAVTIIGMLVASALNGYFQAYFKTH